MMSVYWGELSTGMLYEISRYDVQGDAEQLIEHATPFNKDGAIWCSAGDGVETRCVGTDVDTLIAADALLNEIRANQVTRIIGEPAVLQELPFVLRVPGHRNDFDESLWSEAMRHEHVVSIGPTITLRVRSLPEHLSATF
jgi:hypothetical protein